ncbi:unnamed protein product [Paramecium pentaurelia]|uniref:Uncharacterized protein n=1 Tax=Paramecium pentaurelia TaxID=43138 RepID=A0A8S1TAX2_9CILI|nr:unnamed protein product [Paramecium pentaurelia]
MFLFILLCITNFGLSQQQNNLICYYESDDSALVLDIQRPQLQLIEIQADSSNGDTRGFGFWSKYIANLIPKEESFFYRPFDDPNCQTEVCQFNGFYFLKLLDDDEFNFAAIILNMNDNPVSLTHDFYLFKKNSDEIQQSSVNFEANNYECIWFYTSILYSSVDQKIRFYTNYNNQLFAFDYKLMSQKITIILGGYDTDISQNFVLSWNSLLFFKGYFSLIQEYVPFFYDDNFFNNLLSNCPYQKQKTLQISEDLFRSMDPNQNINDLEVLEYLYLTKNQRYTVKGWIKQNYIEAYNYYLKEYGLTQNVMDQAVISISQQHYIFNRKTGDRMIDFYYTVDFENNNETVITFRTEFYRIPLQVPLYEDEELRKFDALKIKKDYFYEKTQQWHYLVIDKGRNPVNGATLQLRLYFVNEEPLVYNFGTQNYNSQFSGSIISISFKVSAYSLSLKSRCKLEKFFFMSGHIEDNTDRYDCDSSCKDCNGPTKYHCISCYTELNQFLTQFHSCECLYLNEYNQKSGICEPIERSQSLSIMKGEYTDQSCQFGYFQVQFNNQYFCLQCPQKQEKHILCGDCFYKPITWYLKPICTFDYLQEQNTYAYIKSQRSNIQIDIYYINNEMKLQLVEGASEFCESTQLGCQFSSEFHLGVQIRMKCKTNRYYDNFQCLNCIESCIVCQSKDVCLTCIENHYFNYQKKMCLSCPKECTICQNAPTSDFGYQCLTCQEKHTVNHLGQCKPCGIYCEFCKEDFNIQTQEYFIRCLKCIDNKIMSIRFNGVDCIIIDIPNCQQAFITSKTKLQYNALTYNFQPSNDLSDEQPICALCQWNYLYFFDQHTCMEMDQINCQIGLTKRFIYNGIDYGVQGVCLISDSTSSFSIQGEICNNEIPNCYWCYTKKIKTNAYCLKCHQGYYTSRLSGQCLLCPDNLHCKTCYHSTIGYNDEWKNNIIVLNYYLQTQDNNSYFYWNSDQSQNLDDYQIICTSCYSGYVLKDNKCIKYCDDSCKSCIYLNDKYVCQTCGQNIYHNLLSLVQYQCSVCPSYCELCRERTDDEILSVNSLFIKTISNSIYTYQCLKPYENDETLFYDSTIGQFISCQNSEQCENVLTFELNLFCQDEDYFDQLQLIQDTDLKNQFKKQNIMFSQLLQSNIQGNSFQIFDIDSIYEIMNKKTIKRIKLILQSNIDQVCSIPQLSYITQAFSQNVFSAMQYIYIQLKIVIFNQHLNLILKKNCKQQFLKNYTLQILQY